MQLTEALTWIANQGSRIFTVRFVKRTDQSIRVMNCILGSRTSKGTAADGDPQPAYDPTDKGLIWVYDVQSARKGEAARRSISVEGLQAIKIDGDWVEVQQP